MRATGVAAAATAGAGEVAAAATAGAGKKAKKRERDAGEGEGEELPARQLGRRREIRTASRVCSPDLVSQRGVLAGKDTRSTEARQEERCSTYKRRINYRTEALTWRLY